jgi:FixJ family two-component response regulator
LTEHPQSPPGVEASGEPVVFVVDDDKSMREALEGLFRSLGLRVKVFGSTAEFMRSTLPNVASCLVLDVRLPEVNGLDFQVELAAAGIHIPIIFMTGHGDIPMTVQAMKAGAVDFLTKPFRHQEMIHAVNRALVVDRKRRAEHETVSELRLLYESLTAREREVIALVSAGLRNKRIAADLGISEITVKVHRVHVMRKMGARSLADLVRIADVLGIHRDKPARI